MRKILLAVTGSISAYKSYDILRGLVKEGHQVKVILTVGAAKFIKSETFAYLGAEAVYTSEDDFNLQANQGNILHIELRKWMNLLVIAPASANTIAKLAGGFCSDLLTSVFLANRKKQVLIFPAMNTEMFKHPIQQSNLNKLNDLDHIFVHPPTEGLLACQDTGEGKLPDVSTIVDFTLTYPLENRKNKVLITTGATNAPLDPVRFLTNPSSGKTGYELAKYYLAHGNQVCLVYGKHSTIPVTNLNHHPNLKLYGVHTTEEMYQAVNSEFETSDVYISSAAISDIKFHHEDSKIKKDKVDKSLRFTWATDILKEMIHKRKQQKIISFAAETDDLNKNFKKKWNKKPVDLLVGNKVNSGFFGDQQGFGTNENEYFMVKQGEVVEQQAMSKQELAKYIYNFTEEQSDQSCS